MRRENFTKKRVWKAREEGTGRMTQESVEGGEEVGDGKGKGPGVGRGRTRERGGQLPLNDCSRGGKYVWKDS